MRKLTLAPIFAALAVASGGCGSTSTSGAGRATVWVTRDRGATVMHAEQVPAGESALQALDRVASVQTRYGGRYVRAVDGVAEQGRRAWFYYVNGYLAGQGAADYRLHAGDVEWWDYRPWRNPLDDSVVVGAFPEPFLHGYGGSHRRAVVVAADRPLGRRLARLVDGTLVTRSAPAGANVIQLVGGTRPRFSARLQQQDPGSPVRFVLDTAFARRLLARPGLARYRYSVP